MDSAQAQSLQESLKVNPAICQLLVQRGITSFEEARDFFRPQLEHLHSPWLMKDMDKAVDRILLAMQSGERILVFGDYDVDGTTSVACMYLFLSGIHTNLDFYIPHRYREGYGVSRAGIDFARETRCSLIISLDCGIKSTELVAYARSLDIDFIIGDHHLPDAELPSASAILNPRQAGCHYPYKELCGCGVGFKLIQALIEKLGRPAAHAWEYLDLVATAIAADIVPITGENRVLTYYGLKKANENPNHGIRALAHLSGLKEKLQVSNLVFMIAPRVNAAGRMDDARKAVQLFIAETYEEALQFGELLHSDNTDRKEADSNITAEALQLIRENPDMVNRKSTVVYQPHWHKGVVGIVASRLTEFFYRPTIVLTRSGDYLAGSARSVLGFNIYEAVHACRHLLLGYGGHFYAAGLTLEESKLEAFRNTFEEVVGATITDDMLIPRLPIDAEIPLKDIRQPFFDIIKQMEPFGPENPKPVFIARKVRNTGYSRVLKEAHIRFAVKQGDTSLYGIGFGMAQKFHLLEQNKPLDLAFRIEENEWQGEKSLQLRVLDLRLSEE